MGLFSSKKKVTVNTTVSRVIPDAQLPHAVKTALIQATTRNSSISGEIVDGMVRSVATRADRMYRYAAKHYPYGLPVSTLKSELEGVEVVQAVIAAQVGGSVTLDYFHLGPVNAIHVAWETLMREHDYDPKTNQLGKLSAKHMTPVYLKNMVAVYTTKSIEESDAETFAQWGVSPRAGYTPERPADRIGDLVQGSHYQTDAQATVDQVRVDFVYAVPAPAGELSAGSEFTEQEMRYGSFWISLESYDASADYYQAKYLTTVGKAGYWTYRRLSGAHPDVDLIQASPYVDIGSYFPFAYFRYDFQSTVSGRGQFTDEFEITDKMLNLINLDYKQMGDAINSNPDIDDVVHALLLFAVPANSQDPVELRYLFDYFHLLNLADGEREVEEFPDKPLSPAAHSEHRKLKPVSRVERRVEIRDKRFHMSFAYEGIERVRVAGKIGAVGDHTGHIAGNTQVYRRQMSDVFYDQITVTGLSVRYHVLDGYVYGGGIGSKVLVIPLDRLVCEGYSLPDKEQLYSRSMHYVMSTYVETSTKWYSSSWFKIAIVVVAIALTLFTGPGGGVFAEIMAATTMSAVAMIVLTSVIVPALIGLAMQQVFTLVAKAIGAEWAMALAVIAAAVGIGMSMQGPTPGMCTPESLWPDRLISASMGLMDASSAQLQVNMAEYQSDLQGFELLKTEQTKALEDGQKLLGMQNLINPFEFIGQVPRIRFGETPDAFYGRTTHAGNIGVMGIDAISSYAELSLTLPTLNETLGGDLNG